MTCDLVVTDGDGLKWMQCKVLMASVDGKALIVFIVLVALVNKWWYRVHKSACSS